MRKPKLTHILDDLVNGRCTHNKASLSRGLMLQCRQPDSEKPHHRLLCYRTGGKFPSDHELETVCRSLYANGIKRTKIGKPFMSIAPSSGVTRYCCVISWPDESPALQGVLPLDLGEDKWQ